MEVFTSALRLSLVAERGATHFSCGGFSCGAQAVNDLASVAVALRLYSVGSVVVEHRLSCSPACGIFPVLSLEGVPGLPDAPQDEAGLRRKFETSHV